MSDLRHAHNLTGCAPAPLASYLKALGILRIVGEQADPTAQGWWLNDVFILRTTLETHSLLDFFREAYRPTAIVGPWGARSGFFPGTSEKTAREALSTIATSKLPRLAGFAATIKTVRGVLDDLKLKDKAETSEEKRRLMMQCRARFPDELLPWLDTTYMLLDEDTKYPPMLGTGGNEGSGSYMSGFAQQVVSVLVEREWDNALIPSLLGTTTSGIGSTQTPGHFSPEAAGGPNAASSSEGGVATNPWDYLLMLEGTLLFAAASVKRLEDRQSGTLGYPFCVRQSGVGYGSSAKSDESISRAELWLPLWSRPSSTAELSALFAEGRAQVHGRQARNGVDFARSVATLGTDRGIAEFQRYGFQQRNGLSYFAVPLGRFVAEPQPQVNLLSDPAIDGWLDSFRRAASSDHAPSRASRILTQLERAILELCQQRGNRQLQSVLIALGEAEAMLAKAPKWREEAFQNPVPLLSPQWLHDCDDGSPEFRLAASLAGIWSPKIGNLRQNLEGVEIKGRWVRWSEDSAALCKVVWNEATLEDNLIAVIQRRGIEAIQSGERTDGSLIFPGESAYFAALSDIESFLRGETDDDKITALVRGLVLLDWNRIRQEWNASSRPQQPKGHIPDSAFALLKLCHSPYRVGANYVPLEPAIVRLAARGRLTEASKLAARRLTGSGLPPAVSVIARRGPVGRRIAAALLFPLGWADINALATAVLKPELTTPSS